MDKEQLLSLIKRELAKGSTLENIKKVLIESGVPASDVEEACRVIASFSSQAVSPAPAPEPTPTPTPAPSLVPDFGLAKPELAETPTKIETPNISPTPASTFVPTPTPTLSPAPAAANPAWNLPEKPRKSKKWLVLSLVLTLLILLGAGATGYAYYAGYFVSMPQVLSQSITAASQAKSANFDTTVAVDWSGLKASTSSLPFVPTELLTSKRASLTASGSYDLNEIKKIMSQALISLNVGTLEGQLEYRLVGSKLYGRLVKLPSLALLGSSSSYLDKWIEIDVKQGQEDIAKSPFTARFNVDTKVAEKLSKEDKAKIVELAKNASFIKVTKKLAPEEINGAMSYRFEFDLDRKGIEKYFQDVETYIQSVGKNDSQLSSYKSSSSLAENLDRIKNFSGQAWIGKADKLPYKFDIEFEVQAYENNPERGNMKIEIVSLFKNWNKSLPVPVPEKTQTFQELMASARASSTSAYSSSSFALASARSSDASIKSLIANLRSYAEIYFDETRNSYAGYCQSSYVSKAKADIAKVNPTSKISCQDSQTGYRIYVNLSDGKYFCADSNGSLPTLDKKPGAGLSCLGQSTTIIKAEPTPSVRLISPNGGETWSLGSTQTIKWASSNLPTGSKVNLEFYEEGKDPNLSTTITTGLSASSGAHTWQVAYFQPGKKYKIILNVFNQSGYGLRLAQDLSDKSFSVVSQ